MQSIRQETKKDETETKSMSPSPSPAVIKAATPPVASPLQQQQPMLQQHLEPQHSPQPGPSGGSEGGAAAAGKKDKKAKKDRRLLRMAGGETWEDPTLGEWDPDDFRIFVGDIGELRLIVWLLMDVSWCYVSLHIRI